VSGEEKKQFQAYILKLVMTRQQTQCLENMPPSESMAQITKVGVLPFVFLRCSRNFSFIK